MTTETPVQGQADAVKDQQQRRSKAVRNAIWLGVAAFGVYFSYVVYLFFGMSGG